MSVAVVFAKVAARSRASTSGQNASAGGSPPNPRRQTVVDDFAAAAQEKAARKKKVKERLIEFTNVNLPRVNVCI